MPVKFYLKLPPRDIDPLVKERIGTPLVAPALVKTSELKMPEVYKRLQDEKEKNEFRKNLLDSLATKWQQTYGSGKAEAINTEFQKLIKLLDNNGALAFGDLIKKPQFQNLIERYTHILQDTGSRSWIHSYVNLGNHPDFLSNPEFDGAFLHPLLIALVSYQIGGPIRIVDARGKDAEPISVQAQDNMLHVDNTPFNDEYKVIVTWEKGKASGPKGQNFVYIPATHKGVRQCDITTDTKEAFSTENASIFITEKNIDQIFRLQSEITGRTKPAVVEVRHDDKPLTTVFAAGSLVHHRYRVAHGPSRSCMILAFHRIKDNPGQFVASTHLSAIPESKDELRQFLFSDKRSSSASEFINAMTLHSDALASKVLEIASHDSVEIVVQEEKELNDEAFAIWKKTAMGAPTVEMLKMKARIITLRDELTVDKAKAVLVEMIKFDKHGPLDLRLYADSHEEIRKWARNRIREMKPESILGRLEAWDIRTPEAEDLMEPARLQKIADGIAKYIDDLADDKKREAKLDPIEKISNLDAYRSLRQLIVDLGEASTRCADRQTFLSTSLFMFMAVDELCRLDSCNAAVLKPMGEVLLANYFSTAILIEMQIQQQLNAQLGRRNSGLFKIDDASSTIADLTTVSVSQPDIGSSPEL